MKDNNEDLSQLCDLVKSRLETVDSKLEATKVSSCVSCSATTLMSKNLFTGIYNLALKPLQSLSRSCSSVGLNNKLWIGCSETSLTPCKTFVADKHGKLFFKVPTTEPKLRGF